MIPNISTYLSFYKRVDETKKRLASPNLINGVLNRNFNIYENGFRPMSEEGLFTVHAYAIRFVFSGISFPLSFNPYDICDLLDSTEQYNDIVYLVVDSMMTTVLIITRRLQ